VSKKWVLFENEEEAKEFIYNSFTNTKGNNIELEFFPNALKATILEKVLYRLSSLTGESKSWAEILSTRTLQ